MSYENMNDIIVPNNINFEELLNSIENFGKSDILYWTTALAGEVGEFCNIVKKYVRDTDKDQWSKSILEEQSEHELADILIYLHLTANHLNINLKSALYKKLEIIKRRRADKEDN